MKKKVLFICMHNSVRSPMAEGLLRALYGEIYEVYSAGIKPSPVNPYAVKVLAEIGIDISNHKPKNINEFQNMKFDYVITLCDNIKKLSLTLPLTKNYIHQHFEDPGKFEGSEEEKLQIFRQTRDKLKIWLKNTFG